MAVSSGASSERPASLFWVFFHVDNQKALCSDFN